MMSAQPKAHALSNQCPRNDKPGRLLHGEPERSAHPTLPESLPPVGMSRWRTLKLFVPISRESWRKLVNAGKAPRPVKLSERCSMWSNAEIHRWLEDPVSYRQEQGDAQ
jgi:prophage regulatory protein